MPTKSNLIALIERTPLSRDVRKALWLLVQHESKQNARAEAKKAGAGAGAGVGAGAGAGTKVKKEESAAKKGRGRSRTKRKRASSPTPAPSSAPAPAPTPLPAARAPRLQDVGSFNAWFDKVFPDPYTDTVCKVCMSNPDRIAVVMGPKVCPHVYAAAKQEHPHNNWPAGIKDIKCSDCRCNPGRMHHSICSARIRGTDFTWSLA